MLGLMNYVNDIFHFVYKYNANIEKVSEITNNLKIFYYICIMRQITGEQLRDEEIKKLEKKKQLTIFEAAKLVCLKERATTPTLWDMENFKKEREKNG